MTTVVWLSAILVGVLTAHAAVNARLLRRPAPPHGTVDTAVSVLLPVRDEAHRVGACLRSLLAQEGLPHLEILVLDDGSTDGTADLVRRIGGHDPRLRLLTGAPLPDGWLGKPYACHQLAAQADPASRVLIFIDADVMLAPDALISALPLLGGFDLLSPYPRVLVGGFGERLVQPLLQWSWLTFLPLRAMERSPRPSLAAAGGQFLLVSREGYRRAGGHAAVRDRVLEDVELARAVKRSGGRIALADGSALASCRMYTSWRELRDGYSKSLWASFGSPAAATAVVLLLLAWYVLPLAAAPVTGWLAGLVAYLLGVVGRMVTGRATGARIWPDALAHPVSVVLASYLIWHSYRLRARGRLSWRGRPVHTASRS